MERIAIVRLDKIGDLILTTPAIASIRATFPESHITAIVNSYNKVVLENSKDIDEIWEWEWSFRSIAKLYKKHFSKVIVFSPTSESYWVAFFSGAKQRVGYVYKSRVIPYFLTQWWLTNRLVVAMDQKDVTEVNADIPHEVEQNLEVVRVLAGESYIEKRDLAVVISAEDEKWAKDQLAGGNWIGLHFSSAWQSALPSDFFSQLLRELLHQGKVFVTFGNEGLDLELPGGVRIFRSLSFSRWGALMRQAEAFISTNTGSVHLAASQWVPVIAIFEPEYYPYHVKRWSPWQVPHRILRKDDPNLFQKIIESTMEIGKKDLRTNLQL